MKMICEVAFLLCSLLGSEMKPANNKSALSSDPTNFENSHILKKLFSISENHKQKNVRLLEDFDVTTRWPNFDITKLDNKIEHLKSFSYQRVTGRPSYLNRNPKAYVAVSILAPKNGKGDSNEDLYLEQQLRQLKPWTHQQNLRNMAFIRSRWVIKKGEIDHSNN